MVRAAAIAPKPIGSFRATIDARRRSCRWRVRGWSQLTGGDGERLAQLRGESLRTFLAVLAAEESLVAARQRAAWWGVADVEINRTASGWRR